ncbi:MAG: hypothetical protein GC161_05975 [Planctomycetaceae bacterium]|nr:hypothetical protein [Planctomycetaceae bacterium]
MWTHWLLAPLALPFLLLPQDGAPRSAAVAPTQVVGLDPLHRAQGEARAALLEGRPEEALELLDGALLELRGAASADLVGARAAALTRLGRFEEALAAATAEVGPNFAVELEAARAERGLGRGDAADRRLRDLLARYPNFGPARLVWAEWLAQDGRIDEALVQCQWLQAQAGDEAAVQLTVARARRAAGHGAAARAQLAAWLEGRAEAPEVDMVRELYVELLLAEGDAASAHREAQVLVRPGADERSLLLAVQASLDAGAPIDALRAAVYALDAAPRSVGALDRIAPLVAGSPLELPLLEERVRRAPGQTSEARLVDRQLELGNAQAALDRLRGAAPDVRAGLTLREGRALAQLGRTDEARALLAPLAAADGEAAYELGLLEARAGHTESALDAFALAARDGGELAADAHQARASLFERDQRYADAAGALAESLAADGSRKDNWQRLARIARMRLGDRPRAVAAYRRFFALGGEDPDGKAYLDGNPAKSPGSPQ